MSSLRPGDKVIISLGSGPDYDEAEFIVERIEIPFIFIYPVGEPDALSAISLDRGIWRVKGAEDIDYKIEFRENPRSNERIPSRAVSSRITSQEEVERRFYGDNQDVDNYKSVANICMNLVLNQRDQLPSEYIDELNTYALSNNYPTLVDNLMGIRKTCDPILRSYVSSVDPDMKTEMMGTQNLARWVQQHFELEEEELLEKQEQEERERELLRQQRLTESINVAIQEVRQEQQIKLRKEYQDIFVCQNQPKIVESLIYIVDPNLIGRRAIIPKHLWEQLFNKSLADNQMIRETFRRETGYYPGRGDDPNIIYELGEEKVAQLLSLSDDDDTRQIFLAFDIVGQTSYVMVTGFHTEDRITMFISPFLSDEFSAGPSGAPSRNVARIKDCVLDRIKSIELKLLRDRDNAGSSIDDMVIKEMLAGEIAEIGVPIVGDILSINIGAIGYNYMITTITNEKELDVFAAAVPPVETDIDLLFMVETADELSNKISEILEEPIDPSLV